MALKSKTANITKGAPIPVVDIKRLLCFGYLVGYPLAVLGPIIVDPQLKSHVTFPSRHYVYAYLCFFVYAFLSLALFLIFRGPTSIVKLYISVCIFLASIIFSLPIFLPEFPHANVVAVGATTAFMSAFSIFVWSIGRYLFIDKTSLDAAGTATLEYIKSLFTFVRQAAFAAVTLFGALFFAAYSTEFTFANSSVTDKSDLFLLYWNGGLQISFYAVYAIIGAVRYFFLMNLETLSDYRYVASRLDETSPSSPEQFLKPVLGRRENKRRKSQQAAE